MTQADNSFSCPAMPDRDFIDYCRTHSDTQRSLFSGGQIKRLARLAGAPGYAALFNLDDDCWHSIDLSDWCKLANTRRTGDDALHGGT